MYEKYSSRRPCRQADIVNCKLAWGCQIAGSSVSFCYIHVMLINIDAVPIHSVKNRVSLCIKFHFRSTYMKAILIITVLILASVVSAVAQNYETGKLHIKVRSNSGIPMISFTQFDTVVVIGDSNLYSIFSN